MARGSIDTREFLEKTPVFTTEQFRSALPPTTSASTVNNRLQHAYQRGYVERIAHGVYASQLGIFKSRIPDPLRVASLLTPDSVVAYHSALEAHGVAHSPFTRITFLTTRTPPRLNYRGYEFVGLPPKPLLVREGLWRLQTERVRRGEVLIDVTSRERTLADCLDRLRWSGGPEELVRSLTGFPSLDVDKLLAHLHAIGAPSVVARVGWILFALPDLWHLGNKDRAQFQSRLGKGPYFLGPREDARLYVPEWRLYVPEHLDPAGLLMS